MTLNKDKIILVTGATGKQGGAVSRQLMQAGIKVRALTRKPKSESAKSLQALGAEVVTGNLNDVNSLDNAMSGVYGVFAMTNFWEPGTGKKEVQQNKNLVDMAKKHDVQHYVFASIARCDDNPNLAHFVTKYECEQYVQQQGLTYTFLRAVYFMDNLKPKAPGANFHWAILPSILGEKTSLQMITSEDIGCFAAKSFLDPKQYLNKTIDVAGDEVTYPQLLAAYKKVFKAEPERSAILKFLLMNMMPEIRKMFNWYREPRFKADIAYLKTLHPQLSSIEDYFQQIKDNLK